MLTTFAVTLLALGQVFPGGGGGVCSLDSTTEALAESYRATAVSGTGYQVDAVLACGVDLGPGARNCLGTNVGGDILLGPASGNTTIVRVYGSEYITNILQVAAQVDIIGSSAHLANTFPSTAVKVTDADGFQINGTTAIKGWVQVAVTHDFGSINNNACVAESVTVTGAAVNDAAWGNANFALPLGVSVGNVRVTATNTVELTLCNVTAGGPLDPASGSYIFRLSR